MSAQTLFIGYRYVTRGEGDAAPLQLVWHAHASGAEDKASQDATMQQEHSYAMAEEGRRDRKQTCGGVLQTHVGRQDGMHRGGGDLQITGTDVLLVR